MDTDYADDMALLANTPIQADSLLDKLELAATGIDFQVNADKAEYMCFNQRGYISKLNGSSLKLVDKFNIRRKQCPVHRYRHQHETCKGMDSY